MGLINDRERFLECFLCVDCPLVFQCKIGELKNSLLALPTLLIIVLLWLSPGFGDGKATAEGMAGRRNRSKPRHADKEEEPPSRRFKRITRYDINPQRRTATA